MLDFVNVLHSGLFGDLVSGFFCVLFAPHFILIFCQFQSQFIFNCFGHKKRSQN